MLKTHSLGKTNWENAYFGGTKRILIEYPFSSLSYDLEVWFARKSKVYDELTEYQSSKLVNILFSQAFKNVDNRNLFVGTLTTDIDYTIKNAELLKERIINTFSGPKLLMPVSKAILGQYIAGAKRTELKQLFIDYGPSILDEKTVISIVCDLPKDQSPDGKKGMPRISKEEAVDLFDRLSRAGESVAYGKKVSEDFTKSFRSKSDVEQLEVTVINLRKHAGSVRLTEEEIIFAKKMEQMLDITHDPKEDIVKNLLQGKMDTEKLAEVLSGNNRVYSNKLIHQSVKPFKVVVLGDYSGSMQFTYRHADMSKIDFQRRIMKALFHLFNDLMGMEDIEFYGHSGAREPVLYRSHSPEYPHFMETFSNFIELEENYDGPILEHIYKSIRAKSNKPVLLISLSDGQPSGHAYGGEKAIHNMKRVMEKMKRDNFVTVGIGMLYSSFPDLYQYSIDLTNLSEVSPVARIINRAVKENLVIED